MIEFFVPGVPRPQARPRTGFHGNFYSPKTDWFKVVKLVAENRFKKPMLAGPILLDLVFNMPKPKKLTRLHHTIRPDLDNLEKAVMDALTQAGIWVDDCQVISKTVVKIYSDVPGVKIKIEEVTQ